MAEQTEQAELRQQRWNSEANFFDRWADRSATSVGPIDPRVVARYSAPRIWRPFSKEFRIRLLGDVRGKSILDVGCGEGENSVLLAKLGARVTGIDISPRAIDIARQHAQASQVADATTFECSPIECLKPRMGPFDVIWCDAVLHHVIPVLEDTLQRLVQMTTLDTFLVFSEPVNLNHTLRRVRRCLPITTEATPDERPLERTEIAILTKYIPDARIRCFSGLGRLDRFTLPNHNYERSSWPRKGLACAMRAVDWGLLSLPVIKNLAGDAVFYGHPRATV